MPEPDWEPIPLFFTCLIDFTNSVNSLLSSLRERTRVEPAGSALKLPP